MKSAILLASALVLVGGTIEVEAKPRAKSAKVRAKKAKKPQKPKKAKAKPSLVGEKSEPVEPVIETTSSVAPAAEPTLAPEAVAESTEPTSEPASSTESTTESTSESTTDVTAEVTIATPRPPRVRITIDDGPVMRRLRYVDDWATDGQTVRGYDLVANAIGVSVAARPLLEVPAHVYARGELVVGVSGSQGPDAEVFSTRSSELQVGTQLGGAVGRVNAAVAFAVGQHAFAIADEMSTRGELVPDTRYRYARLGGSIGVPLGSRVHILADAGYRMLSSSGDLASSAWFPWATGDGVDATLGVQVKVTTMFHAYVRGSVRRYFFAMNPEPGDALVVGGAIDQYLGLAAGLGVAIH